MKLYKIETGFASIEDILAILDYDTRRRIEDLETLAKQKKDISIDHDVIENGKLVFYVFANSIGLEVLKTAISIAGLPNISLIDVTDEVLLNGLEIYKALEFYAIYEKFIIDHLSVDDVLDNISKKGINKLTTIEKKILQR